MVSEEKTSLKKHMKLGRVVLLFIGLFILFAVIKIIGVQEIIPALLSIDSRYILLFLCLKGIGFAIWNLNLKLFVDEIAEIKYTALLPVYFTGVLVNNLTPGPSVGGEPIKAYYLSKIIKRSISTCFAVFIMDMVVFSMALSIFALFSIAYILLFLQVPSVILFLKIGLVLIILGLIAVIYILRAERTKKFKGRADKFLKKIYHLRFLGMLRERFKTYEAFKKNLIEQIEKFKKTIRKLWSNKRRLVLISLFSFNIQFMEILSVWAIFTGLGQPITFIQVLVVVTISGLIGYFVFLPGGTGAVEAAMIAMLSAMGIEIGIAAAATLVSRALFYIVSYGIGFASVTYLHHKYD